MPSKVSDVMPWLVYDVDARATPDARRRAQFRAGWQDGLSAGQSYTADALRRLTWRNLGYRLARYLSNPGHHSPDALFDELSAAYGSESHLVATPRPPLTEWHPRTPEDQMLAQYSHAVPGLFFTEVPLAGTRGPAMWAERSTTRRIDAVRLQLGGEDHSTVVRYNDHCILFEELLHARAQVELVEVKPRLNRVVIGQAQAAYDLFRHQYGREAALVTVCGRGDSAMEWVCEQRGISVHITRLAER